MLQTIIDLIKSHKNLADKFQENCAGAVLAAAGLVTDCLKNGGCVYTCGNGGSAADSQHVAAELVGRFAVDRKALAAVALTCDTSILTAIANDYSFDRVFERQVEALVKKGDLLWAFSTSGASKNVIAAAKAAKSKGAVVLAFTGKANTPLQAVSDVCVAVDAPDTAAAQQLHQLAYHIICRLVESSLCR